MNIEREKETIRELAKEIKNDGLRVFISDSGTYGIYADESEQRVVYFELDFGVPVFSGCYAATRGSGTGWNMTDRDYDYRGKFREMLQNNAPSWANKTPVYLSLESYLKNATHSDYQEVN